ncbi:MAG: LuxR C-terminal-related transcriptional regulator [Cyanobacteria bacterium P01_A01_bin.70]
MDHSDNDPAVFWTYLITALQNIQPDLGVRSLSLLQSPQPPPIESVLMALLNEVTAVEADFAVILDDYHVIETQAIHRGIGFLLSHLPPLMHLVIASRTDPPFSLARLRSRGELTELRAGDLRFTPAEAAAFLNQVMGLPVAAADVAALERRTEGWIAGLQLAALSMKGREDLSGFIAAFSGDDRYILDYLVEEVLRQQPEHIRHFLLQTAMLERMSGSLCDAVTGQGDSRAMLETLERGNLFIIPLDNKRQWYRYHHLFADVLQTHARVESPERISRLHGRASEWYERQELFSDAIHHALAAQNFERAADLIEPVWPAMRSRQQEATVRRWLKLLPDSLIRARPILSVTYALVLLNAGQPEGIETYLQEAERELARLTQAVPGSPAAQRIRANEEQYRFLPASIANARAYRAQALGDFASTISHAQQAMALLPPEEGYERGTTAAFLGLAYWSSGDVAAAHRSFGEGLRIFQKLGSIQIVVAATPILAQMGTAQGRLRATADACEQTLQLAQQRGPMLQGTAELYLSLSGIRYEQGDLAAASQLLQTGEALREQVSISAAAYLWWLVKAQITAAQGDLDTAFDQLHEAAQLYRRSPVPNVRPVAALKVRLWLWQGRLAEALEWLQESGLSVDDEPSYLREYEHLTLARVLIAQYRQGGTDEVIHPVIGLLTRLLAAAEARKRTGSLIKILVALALAREAQGDVEAAIASLERSLNLAEPEGYVRVFAEQGAPMARLLQHALTRGITPAYTQRLLTALETWGQPSKATSSYPVSLNLSKGSPSPPPLIESLSQRELEVLRLLNTELSGPEIARELVVALSTVRTHTKRIYSKLNVTNRRAAVKRAAELDLI